MHGVVYMHALHGGKCGRNSQQSLLLICMFNCMYICIHMCIVHPGINFQNDKLSLNWYTELAICLSVSKLYGSTHNSYGFIYVGFISMETTLTFDPNSFTKITFFLTSSGVN